MKRRTRRSGLALIFVLLLLTMVVYLALSFLTRGNYNLFTTTRNAMSLQAGSVAEAAARQKAYEFNEQYQLKGDLDSALAAVWPNGKSVSVTVYYNGTTSPYASTALGYADVSYLLNSPQLSDTTNSFNGDTSLYSTVTIRAVGSTRASTESARVTRTVDLSYNVSTATGFTDGLNFAYFMNHWAWWSGFSPGRARLIGNAGANGNFDVLDGSLWTKGGPGFTYSEDGKTYDASIYTDLQTRDSTDYDPGSGVYTAGNIQGPGGNAKQQMDNFGEIPIPHDLSEIANADSRFQKMAKAENGTITVKTVRLTADARTGKALQYTTLSTKTIVSDGVYGDGTGERENVVLGSKPPSSPRAGDYVTIVDVDGPVVVKGNVVLQGYVSGRGTLYTGRNLYMAGDVRYANPPSTSPVGTEAVVKNPSTADYSTDQLVYASGGSIVAGDVTNKSGWWDSALNYWLTQYAQPGVTVNSNGTASTVNVKVNDNHEDNGLDGIVNSQQYQQNADGTWVQDKENDGKWTVKLKNTSTGAVGYQDLTVTNNSVSVPSGYTVVAGTGEDTDGDGKYTPPYDYSRDFSFASRKDGNGNYTTQSFTSSYFDNFPSGASSYSSYAQPVNRVDGFMMANNAISGWFGATSAYGYSTAKDVVVFGGEVARHDAQIVALGWGSSSLQTHQDARFANSGDGVNDLGAPTATRIVFMGQFEP